MRWVWRTRPAPGTPHRSAVPKRHSWALPGPGWVKSGHPDTADAPPAPASSMPVADADRRHPMCIHSRSVGILPPNTLYSRSLTVVLCGLGHCCVGPCASVTRALGDVWFSWRRNEWASTLVVLESDNWNGLRPLIQVVNNCARKDRILVRTRGIHDRGHALTAISPTSSRASLARCTRVGELSR